MPTISRFFGITIRMYYEDHAPPHFHAYYGAHAASIGIETLRILDGSLAPRAMGLVRDWATLHREELLVNWMRAQQHRPLYQIEPLR